MLLAKRAGFGGVIPAVVMVLVMIDERERPQVLFFFLSLFFLFFPCANTGGHYSNHTAAAEIDR